MRRTLRAAVPALCLALLAACAAVPDEQRENGAAGPRLAEAPVPETVATTLRVGLARDPRSIDPRSVSDDEGEFVVRALFDGLVDLAPDGRIVATGAERWTVEDDGRTYRFILREARFHDGTAVTAQHHADALLAVFDPERMPLFREELLASLRGARAELATDASDAGDPAGGTDRRWGTVSDVLEAGGVEVVSRRELILRLERTDALLLHRLTDPVLVPLPALATVDPERFAREPVGNGPFRMAGPREPGAFVRLRANDDHHAPALVDELVLQVYADDPGRSQRWADLLAGRLQVAVVPVEHREEARQRFGSPASAGVGAGLHELTLPSSYAYGFVLDVAPYDDVDLRRAISAAIDREAIARELFAAGVEPADAILPPSLGGEAAPCAHCRHDPELARDLVAVWRERVGDAADEALIVLSYPRGGGHVTVAERIASDLEGTLALDVRLQSQEFGSLVRSIVAGDAPVFRYGLRAPLGGEAAGIALLESALRTEAEENWVRWSDRETDATLDAWTPGASPELVRGIESQVLGAAAIVPLLWTRQDLVVDSSVVGFRIDATGRWWPERVRLR